MFQIKDFRSIVASMLSIARAAQDKVTDFSVGSVARTLMESPAVEIEELYLQMLLGLQEAIPVSIYRAFDFEIVDARAAAGIVTLTFGHPTEADLLVQAGTVFEAPLKGLRFFSTADVSIPAGSTQALVMVAATVAGAAGNISANEITQVSSSLPADTVLSNAAFGSGRDSENELTRKSRFVDFVKSLSRGTVHSVRYAAALSTVVDSLGNVQEFVTRVGISEAPGHVGLYIYGSSGLPSAALLSRAQQIIDGYVEPGTAIKVPGYRSAGVEVEVLPMTERAIAFSISASTMSGVVHSAPLAGLITAAASRVIGSVEPGGVLRADALLGAVLAIQGIKACYIGASENVVCGQFEVLRPGVISVAWID